MTGTDMYPNMLSRCYIWTTTSLMDEVVCVPSIAKLIDHELFQFGHQRKAYYGSKHREDRQRPRRRGELSAGTCLRPLLTWRQKVWGTDHQWPHVDEAKVLRKMDVRLIPMLAILYLLSFLDRGNIGNAKIQGMAKDLHLEGNEYNLCATIFFFTYAAFEVPSNLLLKRLRPSVWLPAIMVAWGTVMTLMGLVQNYHGLLIARLFLGVAEAGLYPGVAYYLTSW